MSKAIKNVIKIVGIFVCASLLFAYRKAKEVECAKVRREAEKYSIYYKSVAKWALHQAEKPVAKYLIQNGYRHIAIYGAKEMGELLRKELDGTDIVLAYYVDRNAEGVEIDGIEVFYPEEELPEADAIVVTSFFYYGSIKPLLERKLKCPIISLSDIIDKI